MSTADVPFDCTRDARYDCERACEGYAGKVVAFDVIPTYMQLVIAIYYFVLGIA